MTLKERSQWQNNAQSDWLPETTVEIEQQNLLATAENICKNCRYPLLTLRVLIHLICSVDAEGRIHVNARQLAKTLDAHYDTVTKCLKYLREINVITKQR